MASMSIEYRSLPGTAAAVGRAGTHMVVADRPDGRAGGQGLGFNGAQLTALALGGCFCNDLHYTAEEMGVTIDTLRVTVDLDLGGDPLVVESARISADCSLVDGSDPTELMARARARCTVANSLQRGVDVSFDFPESVA